MTDASYVTKQFEAAERMQSRFRFYFASLVFTLLAASIQTAKFGHSRVLATAELLGWFFFAIAGLAALSYLEWEPRIREQWANRDSYLLQLNDAKVAKLQGARQVHVLQTDQAQPIGQRISNLDDAVVKLTGSAESWLTRAGFKYEVWRWAFVAGLSAMLVARGGGAFASIFEYTLL